MTPRGRWTRSCPATPRPVQIAAFAVALRAKGETPGEIAGLVEAMLGHATPLPTRRGRRGATRSTSSAPVATQAHTVNISTMGALVVAGSGVTRRQARQPGRVVARAAPPTCSSTSACRSTCRRPASPRCVERGRHRVLLRAACSTAGLRHAAVARREMGVPTVFNFLGPLTNPGRPRSAAVGCADARMAPLLANVFAAPRRLRRS